MPAIVQHLYNIPGNTEFSLGGLVGISIRTHGDGFADIAGMFQFGPQQLCSIGLGEYLRFEIDAGGQIQVGMAGSGVTVDTAVLTTPVGVDRGFKRDIRGLVAGNDRACGFLEDLRRYSFLTRIGGPTVINLMTPVFKKPGIDFRGCASAFHEFPARLRH